MKINEKHLVSFASGTSPTDKQGFLLKRGEVNRAFQRRWFVLKGNLLFYFEKKSDRDPIGVIILEGCTVEVAQSPDAFAFELVFQGCGSRTYQLAAASQEEMEGWMRAVTCAGYEYMKLMVAELQRHLDELNSSELAAAAAATQAGGSQDSHVRVDFAAASGSQQGRRQNPFGNGSPSTVNNNNAACDSVQRCNAPRSFEEMHRQFGDYIKQRMQQYVSQAAVLD